MIDAYMTLAERPDSKAPGCPGRLIVEDEAQHHRSFSELVDSVAADVEFRDLDPQVVTEKRIRICEFIPHGVKHQPGLLVGCVVERKRGVR